LAGEQALPFDEDDEEHKEEVEDEEPTYCRDLDKVEIALPRDGDGLNTVWYSMSIPQRMNTRRHNKMQKGQDRMF
jgi:hypothetical protein